MKRLTLTLLVAAAFCAPVHADNQDKQGNSEKGGKDREHAAAVAPGYAVPASSPGKNSAAPVNHGQVVSDCNHRANDRNMKGQDRQDYVEWCTSRGYRYTTQYGPRYWDSDRSCYARANDRGLTGDRREDYLRSCLGKDDDRVVDDRYRDHDKCRPGEPRGKDVLGKSCDD